MSMTATDFQAIAAIIASEYRASDGVTSWALAEVATDIADHCEYRNHRFDRSRFLDECGIENRHRHEHDRTDSNHHTDEVIA